MYRILFSAVIALVSSASEALAEPSFAEQIIGLMSEKVENPYLYEVKDPQNGKAVYLFGTIHFGLGTESLPYWVSELHSKSTLHAYEIEPYGEAISMYNDLQNIRAEVHRIEKVVGLEALVSNLDSISQERINKLEELGFTKAEAYTAVAITDCMAIEYGLLPYRRTLRMLDGELMINSILMGIPTIYLEDDEVRAEAQNLALKPEDLASAEESALKSVEINEFESDDYCIAIDSMTHFSNTYHYGFILQHLRSYLAGEEKDKLGIVHSDDSSTTYRNNVWVPKIEEMISKGNGFVAFGAAHLFGENGLLKLLGDRGYQIRRVTTPPAGLGQ